MPAPDALTISAAARLCQVDRRTLQRAIHAGRLHLDAAHGLDREELLRAGYLLRETPQRGTPQHAPHEAPHATPQQGPQEAPQSVPQPQQLFLLLGRLTIAVEGLWEEVRQLRAVLRQTPHRPPQGAPQPAPRTPQPAPRGTPQPDDCPPFDAATHTLGRLCARGHEWGRTGQTLLRMPGFHCRQCENERARERRAAQRQGLPS